MNSANSSDPSQRTLKRRRWILLLGALVTLGLIAWFGGVFHREPLHKGKPISYWVDRACVYDVNLSDGTPSWEARKQVRDIGPAAVPYLVAKLQTAERARDRWLRIRSRLPSGLQQLFPDTRTAQEIQYGAASTLAMFGADAKPAVPDLVRLLPTVPPALDALTRIGPGASEALPELRKMIATRSTSRAVEVASAIWRIALDTNLVLEVCTNAIAPGKGDAALASGIVMQLGTAAAPAVPFALKLLQDTGTLAGVRGNAASVLGAARVDSPEIRDALLSGTKTEGGEGLLRSHCAMALWRLDESYAPMATRIIIEENVAWKKRAPGIEPSFVFPLELRGLDPNKGIPTLKQLLDSDSTELRREAAEALRQIETKSSAGAKP